MGFSLEYKIISTLIHDRTGLKSLRLFGTPMLSSKLLIIIRIKFIEEIYTYYAAYNNSQKKILKDSEQDSHNLIIIRKVPKKILISSLQSPNVIKLYMQLFLDRL